MLVHPRGAVAITCLCAVSRRVALVTRTNPPNAGSWSLPGGKIELGEKTMVGAARELYEECGLTAGMVGFAPKPFTCTDAIVRSSSGVSHHYVIAQTFAMTQLDVTPTLQAGDDAGEAKWFSLDDLHALQQAGRTTQDVVDTVQRGLLLHDQGLLETG